MSQGTSDRSQASVTLLENNGRIFFFQPDIGVIASDEKLETAYQKFLSARQAFWSEVDRAGLTVGARPTASAQAITVAATGGRSVVSELGLFVAKFCIVLAVIGGIGWGVGVAVTKAVNGAATAFNQAFDPKSLSLSYADVARKAGEIVKDMQSLTKDEKEALQRNVSAISRELEPVAEAWRNPPPRP